MTTGTVLLAYDGSPTAAHAIGVVGPLLGGRPALVVTIWEENLALASVYPATEFGMAPGPIDVETAHEVDEALESRAERMAAEGAALARSAGFDPAEPIVIAD